MMKNTKIPFADHKNEFIPYLLKIQKRINEQDYDSFIVVCGKERRGKSTIAAQIGDLVSKNNLKIENICLTIDEFLKALKESNKGDVIIFDEAGTNLYSREAMSTINRMLTKAFMVSGLKNVCIILCIPNFFGLDSYIRQHRIDILVYVPTRGKFKVYSTKRAREISIKGARMKKIDCVKANLLGWFTKEYPEYIRKAYRWKEMKFKIGYIKDVKRNIEGNYTLPKFAEITGFTTMTIFRWIKAENIKARKIGGKWMIPKSEAERITNEKLKVVGYTKKKKKMLV